MEFTIKIGDFYINGICVDAYHPEVSFITDVRITYNVDKSMRLNNLTKAESLKEILMNRFHIFKEEIDIICIKKED